jgi:outer membrane protein OmpA-like peptidoglycan-associated protein
MVARDSLGKAKGAYASAKANPQVESYAPVPLLDAEKALEKATRAGDPEEMEHLAYLARRKTDLAVTIAEQKALEREIEQLKRESAVMLLQKKEREATLARMEVQSKVRELEKVRLDAEMKGLELERVKREAEEARRIAEARQADIDQLLREVSELKGKQTERGIVLTIGDVLFAFGKADLSDRAMRSIDKLAAYLNKYPGRSILVEGHTDSVGSDAYNLALSERRAEAVTAALVGKGVVAERIVIRGYGKKYPVASNKSDEGRQQNRRVEVVILNEGVPPETMFRQ